MGMSIHVVGFKAPDKVWENMKVAFEACEAAGIDPPKELWDFFGGEQPDDQGVSVEIEGKDAVKEYDDPSGCATGYQVEISKLPKDVTHIRFYNSW